ncbi:uracil-DNA glycosylase family protein [Paraburkholderia sp. BL17N1]|uniref:uracil-DNA glycosylase family protein n=1 Tax=Paraburkholderia sp. BL17N1 TaxID=1938798 RepID=UPI000EAB92FC|nr:uracil-DNA glycosylase family protein [Paraburkholderia sp. BL17N1]RKR45091.1 DNA polymerase [Paraburkholderia sp. BL17N1]
MALHESVLEEFGLTPLWVRRGMAAEQEPVAEPQAQAAAVVGQGAAAPAARRDDARGASPGLPPVARAQETSQPAMRAADVHQANAAPAPGERGASGRPDQASPAAGARERFAERQPPADTRSGESSRSMQSGAQTEPQRLPSQDPMPGRMQASVEASQPQAPQSARLQQPRSPEPPPFDAPPDDDFAWFDDLPTQAPTDARHEAPAAPAIHTLDWDALSERVAACQLCRLCEKRTNTVFGVGDRGADWMLIGEAPGENEDRLGEPFVGQAGKLLDNMLRSLTLARDTNVYIANVIKCRPPGNRNPEADEVARCEPYLQRQVALVKPKLIVALGRFAAQSLLKTEASISSLRGRVHEYEGVPVIVTYHPAYLLRSLPDKAKAWADLCLARDTWRAAGGTPSNASK